MSQDRLHGLDRHLVDCAKLLRANAYRHRLHRVFSDFVEMTALSISNSADLAQAEKREARYMQIVGAYDREEVARFPLMLGHLVESLTLSPSDALGALFTQLELFDHWRGQFFTPYEISKMMARLNIGAITEDEIARKGGYITVLEPACGAGGMLIAVAEHLLELGLNPQTMLHATAQDIDPTACHMAYVQLALLGIPAIVLQGNTLKLTVDAHWVTPMHALRGWDYKLKQRRDIEAIGKLIATEPRDCTAGAVATTVTQQQHVASQAATIVDTRAEQMALF